MTNPANRPCLVIRASALIRHSSFVIDRLFLLPGVFTPYDFPQLRDMLVRKRNQK
jgi:hypothetical protein